MAGGMLAGIQTPRGLRGQRRISRSGATALQTGCVVESLVGMQDVSTTEWLAIALGTALGLPILFLLFVALVLARYGHYIYRIFEAKPLFLAPAGKPSSDAQRVELTVDGCRRLVGGYLPHTSDRRRGVILFCHEFTANRWLFEPYVGYLRSDGFDVFTFDFCNHGESDQIADYDPLQWVTAHEIADVRAAVAYLKSRDDAPAEIGLFGVSKGGGAGLVVAGDDPFIQAVVTDGAFPTHGTVVKYEIRWVEIYSSLTYIHRILPRCFYSLVCEFAVWRVARHRGIKYIRVERGIRRYSGRPLLMIHGARDNYITQDIVERFFALGSQPKELWFVKGAKHNGSLDVAGDEYRTRVREFFRAALAADEASESFAA